MKTKDLEKLITKIESTDPKEITAKLLSHDDVDYRDMKKINKILESKGLVRNKFKIMTAIRKTLKKDGSLEDINSWEDLEALVTDIIDDYKLPKEKAIRVVRNAMKRDGLDVPRRPSLGPVKMAIVAYFTESDAPTAKGCLAHLLEEDFSKTVAQKAVSLNFAFAAAIFKAGVDDAAGKAEAAAKAPAKPATKKTTKK